MQVHRRTLLGLGGHALLAHAVGGCASTLATSRNHRGGPMSASELVQLHDVMSGYVRRGEVPGIVTLVSRGGDLHVDALGTKALGKTDPVRRDTIFRIT